MHEPANIHRLFAERFAAADLDGLLELYAPDALLLPQAGSEVRGHAAIREALGGFIALGGRFTMAPPRCLRAGDIAVLHADWQLSASGPDGQPIHLGGHTADVVQRQADGTWRIVIDNPWGDAVTA